LLERTLGVLSRGSFANKLLLRFLRRSFERIPRLALGQQLPAKLGELVLPIRASRQEQLVPQLVGGKLCCSSGTALLQHLTNRLLSLALCVYPGRALAGSVLLRFLSREIGCHPACTLSLQQLRRLLARPLDRNPGIALLLPPKLRLLGFLAFRSEIARQLIAGFQARPHLLLVRDLLSRQTVGEIGSAAFRSTPRLLGGIQCGGAVVRPYPYVEVPGARG
jgi:hypothetical protein